MALFKKKSAHVGASSDAKRRGRGLGSPLTNESKILSMQFNEKGAIKAPNIVELQRFER